MEVRNPECSRMYPPGADHWWPAVMVQGLGRGVSHRSLRMERQLLRLMVSSGLNILQTSLPGTSRHGRRIALPALHLFTSADRFF